LPVIDAIRWEELRKQVEEMLILSNQVECESGDYNGSDAYDKVLYFMSETEEKQKIADIRLEIQKEEEKLSEYWPTDDIDDVLVLHGLPTSRKAILIRIDTLKTQVKMIEDGEMPI